MPCRCRPAPARWTWLRTQTLAPTFDRRVSWDSWGTLASWRSARRRWGSRLCSSEAPSWWLRPQSHRTSTKLPVKRIKGCGEELMLKKQKQKKKRQTGANNGKSSSRIHASHLIIEIQIDESWDTLGELSHFSHRFGWTWLTALEETQLQSVHTAMLQSQVCSCHTWNQMRHAKKKLNIPSEAVQSQD